MEYNLCRHCKMIGIFNVVAGQSEAKMVVPLEGDSGGEEHEDEGRTED